MSSPHGSRSPLRIAFAGLLVGWVTASCADPTEIRLTLHTNLPCTDPAEWKGVAVYVGEPNAGLETKAPAVTSNRCDEHGQVGTLVVVPSGAKNAEIGIRVVAGLGFNPEACAAHHYQSCIVARRSVRFDQHSTIDLDIALDSECRNLSCDTAHTCMDGICTDTRTSAPILTVDTPATVRCGDNGVVCGTTGDLCCLTVDRNAGTTFGQCLAPALCPPATGIVLACDDESDCATSLDDAGNPGLCLLDFIHTQNSLFVPDLVYSSQCLHRIATAQISGFGVELCTSRAPCQGGQAQCVSSADTVEDAGTNPLPNYFWCYVRDL